MKFRTDFVTNSSDSSFLTFTVKNPKLLKYFNGLGINFDSDTFHRLMRTTLPSGTVGTTYLEDDWVMPFLSDYNSVSAWIVGMMLYEVHEGLDREDYNNFTIELIDILNEADITHLDWEVVEDWSREDLDEDLDSAFSSFDKFCSYAMVEHTYGFEGETGPCSYVEMTDDRILELSYSDYEPSPKYEVNGTKFFVSGGNEDIIHLIRENGGSVTDIANADFFIAESLDEMELAKKYCIPFISCEGFMRLFGFSECGEIDSAFDITYEGGMVEFIFTNGIKPIIWKVNGENDEN